jgi:uncharacterized protein with ParB-like and HNH nuclease domain
MKICLEGKDMEASQIKVDEFFASPKTHFVIPVYQWNYDWSESQCKQLLDDILAVGINTEMNVHFIGSIVFVHDDIYTAGKIKKLTIIDGQQRLTTLTLIYLVLYKLAIELKKSDLADEIYETYLINKHVVGDEKLKLQPAENNYKALKDLFRRNDIQNNPNHSNIITNFTYFENKIKGNNYSYVLNGLSKLMFVEISLDREKDDPQRIFECLNSTGLELSQADLIRNYILMGLDRTDQNEIYQDYWEIIESLAKDEEKNINQVSEFIRDYLTMENNKIPNIGKVYHEFKEKYPRDTLENLKGNLSGIMSYASYYNKLLNPKNEPDKEIRLQLEYIKLLEIKVTYPFLMKVYYDYNNNVIDKKTFLSILDIIQSYTWRRFIVGLPTNALNKVFMALYDKVDENNYLQSVQRSLLQRSGSQKFPNDSETKDILKAKDVYNIKTKNRIYLFERLENHCNKERVIIDGDPQITFEHIFPQNPDVKWRTDLCEEEYNFIKERYLHTIGNLTLSGNNGKLGNKSFVDKRDLKKGGYKDSRLWLNKHLSTLDKWDKSAIEKRSDIIAERFFDIWKMPELPILEENNSVEVNIFEAEYPTHKKLEYAIFNGQKIDVKEISKLYTEVFRQLFNLHPETFFTSEIGTHIGLTTTPIEGKPRQPVAINDTYFIEANFDNAT